MLFEKLKNLDMLPMHMPGHKRNTKLLGRGLPYELDITEIGGFDDLHEMQGILRDMAETAALLYGAEHAFPMVNGSTGGILAAVRAVAGSQGSIVMSRFSHRAVYNAAELCGLSPVYLLPEQAPPFGVIAPETVAQALENTPDARCAVLTSPTYEGFTCDIAAMSEISRARGVPLIVDAAHGAHFGFSEHFPKNAVRCGADIEILSLHKTLPALTQSSLALVGKNSAVPPDALERELRVFETSSPSYILLASIDRCLGLLQNGRALFKTYVENLRYFREKTSAMEHLEIIKMQNTSRYDMGKIIISTEKTDITGKKIQHLLREDHNIELEMATPDYALAMTSICDTRDSFDRLADALARIDRSLRREVRPPAEPYFLPKRAMPPYAARGKGGAPVPLSLAKGRMALEYIWAYPPGIPILAPGEIVDDSVISQIRRLESSGIRPRSDYGGGEIMCAEE